MKTLNMKKLSKSTAQHLVSIVTFLFLYTSTLQANIQGAPAVAEPPLRLMLSPARAERPNTTTTKQQPTTQQDTSNQTTIKPQIQSQAPSPPISSTDSPLTSSNSNNNPSATIPTTFIPSTSSSSSKANLQANSSHTTTGQPPENTWLESILSQVEDSLNQQHEQPFAATDDGGDLGPAAAGQSSSLAPTDSGEDPLESTTTLATPDYERVHTGGTQYSINSPSPIVMVVSHQSSTTTTGGDTQGDEEQRLVESNNVSAIVAHSSGRNQWQAHQTTGESQQPPIRQPVGCDQAYTQCALRKVCAPALKAYNDECQELITNRTSQCSPKCLKAMIALRSSEEGDDLVNCDCQSNEYCLLSKQRSQACRPQVEQAVDPKTVVSCSTASWICLADQLCSTALDYYYRNCQSLFSQRHCSMRCNNSLSILYRQPKASKLINCHCDGSEEFPCVKYKTYTERLCLNKQHAPSQQTTGSAGGIINLEDHVDGEGEEEVEDGGGGGGGDDGFNMTNDPETFMLAGSQGPSQGGGGDNYNDEDEFDGDLRAGGEEPSQGPNGIQLVENNWIPLMSGRYFTNLHRRRQQQQQQQQTRHKQGSQTAAAASQRKSVQKHARQQKSKSNNDTSTAIRRRYHNNNINRLMVLASTSSSSAPPTWSHLTQTWLVLVLPIVVLTSNFYQVFVTLML